MKIRIFDIENWREIGQTLARNKTRTLLTAFGIFWGTAMLAMLMGGSEGLRGMLVRNFEGFATNMGACFVQHTTKPYRGFNKGMSWPLTVNDIDFVRRANPHLDLSTTSNQTGGSIQYADKATASQILGVNPDYFRIQLPVVHSGRVLNESDDSQIRKSAVIGKNVATSLFGSDDPIGRYIKVNQVYFMVVGVVSQTSEASLGAKMDDAVLIPATTMRRAFNLGTDIDAFIYTAKPGYSPKDIEPTIRHVYSMNHPVDPTDKDAIWFLDVSEQFEMVDNLFLGISLLAIFVGAGTLLAGAIGIGNIMWIIVKERTREIGIRRAIGAKPVDIIAQILSEGMVLTAIAGIAGICFAVGVLAVADTLTYDPALGSAHFQLSLKSALGITFTFLILGTCAGIVPAFKAMRIKPVAALNDK
ncbi:MAG: ABC transporter permease [Paramuribaculum sp.]|nr:ABC transporter permease [Paramuribaculum sp.]